MRSFFRAPAVLPMWAVLFLSASAAAQSSAMPSIRSVQVLRTHGQVQIEVEASDRVVPQTNVLAHPDRLVIDFVNATPGAQLRNQSVNRAEVKSLRVGLFSANPPVTRIVVDLNGPQPYKVFPSGRNVIVKIGGAGAETVAYGANSGPGLVISNYSNVEPTSARLSVEAAPAPRPKLAVSFQDGLLTIFSNKANLSEVLFAVHERTGADIAIPAGAEQEQVVAELGPAPAPEVLSHLLNGSKFNFLILNSSSDPKVLDRVILSSRPEGPMPQARPQPRVIAQAEDDDDADAQPKPSAPVRAVTPPAAADPSAITVPPGTPPAAPPEPKAPGDNDVPD